jgi:hypothetical protein
LTIEINVTPMLFSNGDGCVYLFFAKFISKCSFGKWRINWNGQNGFEMDRCKYGVVFTIEASTSRQFNVLFSQ